MGVDIGKLILRLVLGGTILLHGIAKLTGGIEFISGSVTSAGLPAFVAYGVYVGEVVGQWHRLAPASWHAVNEEHRPAVAAAHARLEAVGH